MKLSPLEQAFEKAAVRILRKHAKEIESAATLFYTRAVGQAVEHLHAKTSPAVKANKTRKEIAKLRKALGEIKLHMKARADGGELPTFDTLVSWIEIIDDALAPNEGRPA